MYVFIITIQGTRYLMYSRNGSLVLVLVTRALLWLPSITCWVCAQKHFYGFESYPKWRPKFIFGIFSAPHQISDVALNMLVGIKRIIEESWASLDQYVGPSVAVATTCPRGEVRRPTIHLDPKTTSWLHEFYIKFNSEGSIWSAPNELKFASTCQINLKGVWMLSSSAPR